MMDGMVWTVQCGTVYWATDGEKVVRNGEERRRRISPVFGTYEACEEWLRGWYEKDWATRQALLAIAQEEGLAD